MDQRCTRQWEIRRYQSTGWERRACWRWNVSCGHYCGRIWHAVYSPPRVFAMPYGATFFALTNPAIVRQGESDEACYPDTAEPQRALVPSRADQSTTGR